MIERLYEIEFCPRGSGNGRGSGKGRDVECDLCG